MLAAAIAPRIALSSNGCDRPELPAGTDSICDKDAMALAQFPDRQLDPERSRSPADQSMLDSRPKLLKNTDC